MHHLFKIVAFYRFHLDVVFTLLMDSPGELFAGFKRGIGLDSRAVYIDSQYQVGELAAQNT